MDQEFIENIKTKLLVERLEYFECCVLPCVDNTFLYIFHSQFNCFTTKIPEVEMFGYSEPNHPFMYKLYTNNGELSIYPNSDEILDLNNKKIIDVFP